MKILLSKVKCIVDLKSALTFVRSFIVFEI